MDIAKNKIISLLKNKEVIKQQDVKELLPADKYNQNGRQLVELLNALKTKHIVIKDSQHSDTIKLISQKVKANLLLNCDDDGLLRQLLLQVDSPTIKTFNELHSSMAFLTDTLTVGAYINDKSYQYSSTSKSYAVASLVKLLVAIMILEAVKHGQLSYDFSYRIEQEDLSYLSAGLSKKDIGQTKTIRELLSLLLLASDNSAMDILLKLIKQYDLHLQDDSILDETIHGLIPTKQWLNAAWCKSEESEIIWRKKALSQVKWTEGLDYFMTPNLIAHCIKQLVTYDWLPYDDLGTLIYKGGNSAGVLSGVWASHFPNTSGNYVFFAVNNQNPIDILEQTYYQQCIQSFIENNMDEFSEG